MFRSNPLLTSPLTCLSLPPSSPLSISFPFLTLAWYTTPTDLPRCKERNYTPCVILTKVTFILSSFLCKENGSDHWEETTLKKQGVSPTTKSVIPVPQPIFFMGRIISAGLWNIFLSNVIHRVPKTQIAFFCLLGTHVLRTITRAGRFAFYYSWELHICFIWPPSISGKVIIHAKWWVAVQHMTSNKVYSNNSQTISFIDMAKE